MGLVSRRSEAQTHVCLPVRGAAGECYYNTLLCFYYFSSSSVVSRFLCAMRVYTRSSGIILTPRLLLCQNFVFCGFRCWASRRRKSRTQSLSQSLTYPAYLMSQEPKRLHFRIC